jgi:hypothetical protein
MPNLEELKLSMIEFQDFKDLSLLKVPQKLEKLHLEFGCHHCRTSFETTKIFLNVFRSQLRSLTFISVNVEENFCTFDKFHSLVSDFSRLETFKYYIHTDHQDHSTSLFPNVEHLPDSSYSYFTLPRPPQFDITGERTMGAQYLSSDLTLSELFNCHTLWVHCKELPTLFVLESDFRLLKLQTIDFINLSKNMTDDQCRYISKVISLSPNLTYLQLSIERDTMNLIKQLSQIVSVKQRKQITYFELGIAWNIDHYYHSTFLPELSEILPNLKTLTICIQQRFHHDYFPLNEFIKTLRSNFRKLSRLLIQTWFENDTDQNVFERCKKNMVKVSQQTKNSTFYTIEKKTEMGYFLNIWL